MSTPGVNENASMFFQVINQVINPDLYKISKVMRKRKGEQEISFHRNYNELEFEHE